MSYGTLVLCVVGASSAKGFTEQCVAAARAGGGVGTEAGAGGDPAPTPSGKGGGATATGEGQNLCQPYLGRQRLGRVLLQVTSVWTVGADLLRMLLSI